LTSQASQGGFEWELVLEVRKAWSAFSQSAEVESVESENDVEAVSSWQKVDAIARKDFGQDVKFQEQP
jgi:hypothetical protein